MKHILGLIALVVTATSSQAAIITFSVPVNQAIPDGDLAGMVSQTTVSGVGDNAYALAVDLSIGGTYNGDLYAYVTHNGQTAVLLDRAGVTPADSLGYGDHGFNVTFVDGAPDIHYYRLTLGDPAGVLNPLTGTWGPDSTATTITTLNSLLSGNPDGQWTLFVADESGGDLNALNSWGLEFAVPETKWWGIASFLTLAAVAARKMIPVRKS